MRFFLTSCWLVLALSQAALAAPGGPFVGRVDKLVADPQKFVFVDFKPLGAEATVPVPLEEGARAFGASTVPWPGAKDLPLILVESADGHFQALFYDRNLDGKIAPEEKAAFPPAPQPKDVSVEVYLPLDGGLFPDYPLLFKRFSGEMRGPNVSVDSRFFIRSRTTYVHGTVAVEGRQVAVRYAFIPGAELDLATLEQCVDSDGDGKFGGPQTPETDGGIQGQSEAPLFPVGALYLATRKIDWTSGRIEMTSHPASEYRRVLLTAGSLLPDFTFADYAGRSRKLSDLRGKVVLLDFWASWCAPCIAEFPLYKEVYAEYRGRGFEIVTIAWGDTAEKTGKLVEKEQLPWLQGTAESTEEIATKHLRLQYVPFLLLLDAQGRILSTGAEGQLALHGENLKATVAKLFPETPATAKGR